MHLHNHSDLLLRCLSYASVPVTVAGPLTGWYVFRYWRSWTWKQRVTVVLASILCVSLAFLVIASPLSFRGFAADAMVIGLGYIAFCCLAFASLRAAPPLFRIPIGFLFTAALAPLALTVLSGMGVVLAADSLLPAQETALTPHLLLRTTEDSSDAPGRNSEKLELVQQPDYLPGLEVSRYTRWVSGDECASRLLHLSIAHDKAIVLCGRHPLDSFTLPED